MSEQLTQNEVITNGEFGNYVSLSIGSSTINQLKKAKKLPSKDYGDYGNLKPDGLLIDERNKKDISVICVILLIGDLGWISIRNSGIKYEK